jgi:hypothetical protein
VRRKLTILTLLAILAVVPLLLLSGCNILGWTSGDYSGLGHLEKGKKLLREGKYQEAEAELALAIGEDPYNSETRYYHAKALVLAADIDIMWLVDQVDQLESQREEIPLPIFTPDPDVTLEEDIVNKNGIYQANIGVREDLIWIIDRRATGRFKPDDIVVDLSVATILTTILGLRDTDQDGDIDGDDILLQIVPNNGGYKIEGLDQLADNPESINDIIDFVVDLTEDNGQLIEYIMRDIDPELDFEEIEKLNQDIVDTAELYRYDDDIDNDGNNGADEETLDGVDNDHDGLTDEDTDHV